MHLKGQANTNCLPCCLSLSALVFPFHCCCCCCWLPSDLICVEFRLKTNEMDSKSLPFSAVFPPVRFSEPHSYGLLHTRPSHSAYHARELRGYFIIFSVYPFDSPFFSIRDIYFQRFSHICSHCGCCWFFPVFSFSRSLFVRALFLLCVVSLSRFATLLQAQHRFEPTHGGKKRQALPK